MIGYFNHGHLPCDQRIMTWAAKRLRSAIEYGDANHTVKRLMYGDRNNPRSLVSVSVWLHLLAGAPEADGLFWLTPREAERIAVEVKDENFAQLLYRRCEALRRTLSADESTIAS